MAKLVGLFGKASGKKGDAVLAVRNGEQIMRQWNPIVKNPNTTRQMNVRAKMKLMSQFSAVVESIIAIDPLKAASPRNIFVKTNYGLVTINGNAAEMQLKDIQLTKSAEGMVDFSADRTKPDEIAVFLNEANTNNFDAVVYAALVINADGSMRVWDSTVVTTPGDSRIFRGSLAYTLDPIVIYAYGVAYNDSRASVAFSNIEGEAASFVAGLIVNHSQKMVGSSLTMTKGLVMGENETTGSSSDVDRRSITINVTGNGTATGAGSYAIGTTVTLVATAGSGATFQGWYQNGALVSSNASMQVVVTNNVAYEARFTGSAQNYTLGLSATPTLAGSVTGAGSYPAGTTVNAVATANNGYHFVRWTEGGNTVSTNATYSFVLNGNRSLVAVFEADAQQYTVQLSAKPAEGGNVSGAGQYAAGASVRIEATPNSGYTFAGWYNGGTLVSNSAVYEFTANANVSLEANFTNGGGNQVVITTASNGTYTGAGTYNVGDSVTLKIQGKDSWDITDWSIKPEGASTWQTVQGSENHNTLTFTASQSAEYRANFIDD